VNCGPRSISFILLLPFTFTRSFTFLKTITFYHLIRLIICSQQTGEIDNLTVSWDKVLGCVVCRFHVAASEKLHSDKFPGAIVRSVAKLAGIDLRKCGSFSYWFDKPWCHNWGKLAVVLIITFSWGFPISFLVSTMHQRYSNQLSKNFYVKHTLSILWVGLKPNLLLK
jgi:hypothetical protein